MSRQPFGSQGVQCEEESRQGPQDHSRHIDGSGIVKKTGTQYAACECHQYRCRLRTCHPLPEQRDGEEDYDERCYVLEDRGKRQGYPLHGPEITYGVQRRPEYAYDQNGCESSAVDTEKVPAENRHEYAEYGRHHDITQTGDLYG